MNLIVSITKSRVAEQTVWWKPERAGYTTKPVEAGRYTDEETAEIERGGQSIGLPEKTAKKILLTDPEGHHPFTGGNRIILETMFEQAKAIREAQAQPT